MIESFDPASPLIGGTLIGLSAVFLMGAAGRIAGVSGILGRVFTGNLRGTERVEALAFLVGLLAAPWALAALVGHLPARPAMTGLVTLVVAGALVGSGATLANGCTSGHGVCGLARFSSRSLAAVATFMAVAVLTVAARRLTGTLT